MLNGFLTDIMLLAGLGAVLDNVFITTIEKNKISAYLEGGTEDLSLTQRFSKFLETAHSIIFGRFFNTRLFSLRFLASAASVSVISFCTVFAIQFYLYPHMFSELLTDPTQMFLFISFLLFNIVFDYATIIQTKVFIEASLSTRSIFRAIIFIVSDLIVTMNTFILSYALFVLIVVQVFIFKTEHVRMIIPDGHESVEITPEAVLRKISGFEGQEYLSRLKYEGSFSILLTADDEKNATKTNLSYDATFDLKTAQTRAYLALNTTNMNLSDPVISAIENEDDANKYAALFEAAKSNIEREFGDLFQKEVPIIAVDFEIDGSIFRDASLMNAYTSSFDLTDELENSFPESVMGPIELPRLTTLIGRSVASVNLTQAIAVCIEAGMPTKRFILNDETVGFLSMCGDFVVISPVWVNALDRELALVGRNTDGYRVPFNTLLITSILPTAFFYLAIVLLAIATVCFSKVVYGTNRIKKFFLRAPLAISGAILGAALSLIGVI